MPKSVNDRVRGVDWLVALATGVGLGFLLHAWSAGGLDPSLWEAKAVADGLVAPRAAFFCAWFSLPVALSPVLGSVGGGLLAFLIVLCMRTAFVLLVRPAASMPAWRRWQAILLSVVAAVLVVTADPVWRSCQVLTPTLQQLIGLTLIGLLFLRWLTIGSLWRPFVLAAIAGRLASDGPYAFLLLFALVLIYRMTWKDALNGVFKSQARLLDYDELPYWRMLACFLATLVTFSCVNVRAFVTAGGLDATGWSQRDLWFHHCFSYLSGVVGVETSICFLILLVVGVLPALAAMRILLLQASDEDRLPFPLAFAVAMFGGVAALQVLPFPSAWFWRWGGHPVDNSLAVALTCTLAALAAVLSVACFVVNGRESVEDSKASRGLQATLAAVALGVVALSLVGRERLVSSDLQRLIDDAMDETVRETAPGSWVFTDGRCDLGLELAARRQGRAIRAVNLTDTSSAHDVYLRTRGLTNAVDVTQARRGSATLLARWIGEGGAALDAVAVQLGVERIGTRAGRRPVVCGLVARLDRPERAEVERGAAAARELAARALRLSREKTEDDVSPMQWRVFSDVVWRLSRFARLRGETELADELDAASDGAHALRQAWEDDRVKNL